MGGGPEAPGPRGGARAARGTFCRGPWGLLPSDWELGTGGPLDGEASFFFRSGFFFFKHRGGATHTEGRSRRDTKIGVKKEM